MYDDEGTGWDGADHVFIKEDEQCTIYINDVPTFHSKIDLFLWNPFWPILGTYACINHSINSCFTFEKIIVL